MARYTFRTCRECGQIHQTNEWPGACLEQFRKKRSELAMPYIRADGMDPIMNHANGRMYDSRSAYERGVKDAGCVIVGDDMPTSPKVPEYNDRDLMQDIKTSIEKVEAGYHE